MNTNNPEPRVLCTKVCNNKDSKKSSKTVLVELSMKNNPKKVLTAYAIIDEQSNTTLVDETVVEYFGINFSNKEFSIKFAS